MQRQILDGALHQLELRVIGPPFVKTIASVIRHSSIGREVGNVFFRGPNHPRAKIGARPTGTRRAMHEMILFRRRLSINRAAKLLSRLRDRLR